MLLHVLKKKHQMGTISQHRNVKSQKSPECLYTNIICTQKDWFRKI